MNVCLNPGVRHKETVEHIYIHTCLHTLDTHTYIYTRRQALLLTVENHLLLVCSQRVAALTHVPAVVLTYTYTYIYTYTHTHTHIYIYVTPRLAPHRRESSPPRLCPASCCPHTRTGRSPHIHIYIHIYIHTHTYIYIYVTPRLALTLENHLLLVCAQRVAALTHVPAVVLTYTYTYIYTYTHTHTHTHIYIYT